MNWSVSDAKARDYLLNSAHPVGGPKARFFLARGFSRHAWPIFAEALGRHPIDNPVSATQHTPYGLKLVVRCRISTPDGSDPCIRTVWMAEPGGIPRLVTAYPSES